MPAVSRAVPPALRLALDNLGPTGRGLAAAALGAIAFSGKAIIAKLMYRVGADPISVVGLRMAMALPLFMLMAWAAGRGSAVPPAPLSRRQWIQVALLGFSGYYLASTLDFLGLRYISASLERAILYLNPTLVLLLSAVWFRHRVRPAQLAAVALAYAGVAVVWLHDWDAARLLAGGGPGTSGTPAGVDGLAPLQAIALGSALVFGSALAYAVYLMGSGRLVQQLGSMRLVGYASCIAGVLCLLQWVAVAIWTGGAVGGTAALPWQAYALSAVNAVACTVLPVWLVMRGVQLLGASVASQVGMVGPLSTIWMAAWWLSEPVTWRLVVGTAAILAGTWLIVRAGAVPPPQRTR